MEKHFTKWLNIIMFVFLCVVTVMAVGSMTVTGQGVWLWWVVCAALLLLGLGVMIVRFPIPYILPALTIVFLGGLCLRLAWIFTVPTVPQSDYKSMLDAAAEFARGKTDVFALGSYFHRFPHLTFYVVTVGILFRLFGETVWIIKGMNAAFSASCILIAYLIGKELGYKRLGLLFSLLIAIFPPLICYTSVAATELFAMPFLMLSLLFTIKAYRADKLSQKLLHCALSGLLLSLGSLYRMVGPLYLAAYSLSILIIFTKGMKWKSLLALFLAYFALFFAVDGVLFASGTTPYHLNDSGTPFSMFFLIGFNPESGGMFNEEDHQIYFECNGDREAMKQEIKARLIPRITEHPLRLIPLFFKKTFVLWGDGDFAANYWAYDQGVPASSGAKPHLMLIYHLNRIFYIVLLLFCLAALFWYHKNPLVLLLSLMVLGFEGAYMLLEVQPRYTFSIAYMFVFLGAIGIFSLSKRLLGMECNDLPSTENGMYFGK